MADKTDKKTEQKTPLKLEKIDVSSLPERVRLYALAKMLGVTSKDVVHAFADMGEKKNVQAGLSHDDINAVIAKLSGESDKPKSAKKAAKKTAKKTAKKAVKKSAKKTTKKAAKKAAKKSDTQDDALETHVDASWNASKQNSPAPKPTEEELEAAAMAVTPGDESNQGEIANAPQESYVASGQAEPKKKPAHRAKRAVKRSVKVVKTDEAQGASTEASWKAAPARPEVPGESAGESWNASSQHAPAPKPTEEELDAAAMAVTPGDESNQGEIANAPQESYVASGQAEPKKKPAHRAKRAVKRSVKVVKTDEAQGASTEASWQSAADKTSKTDQPVEPAQPDAKLDEAAEAEEKLRNRVRKNVANEISQIEDKVEAELAESAPESTPEHDADYEHDYGLDIGTVDPELLREAIEESDDDFDGEYGTPLLTPMPDDEPEVYEFAPIFMAPTTTEPRTTPARAERQAKEAENADDEQDDREEKSGSKRRGRRGTSRGRGRQGRTHRGREQQEPEEVEVIEEPRAIRGSTRIEAQRRRRAELREKGRERRHIVSQAEFLARRESVERTMVVRERDRADHPGTVTQVGVLEDGLLVEHFVTSEAQASLIGNIYLGRVQNVLPSMEAAFIDIGLGRNGVLYAGEVDWRSTGLGGRSRRIEQALKSGDQVLVQVAKDPIGQKGARLTTQISLAGRYLVYVPGGRSAGISRKLPAPERKRLKEILERVVPGKGGAIIRTAAENVPEEAIAADVNRLHDLWNDITERADKEKNSKGAKPVTMYEEPNMLVKVVRDLFNEDFTKLIVDGHRPYNKVAAYVESVAPDLADRVEKFNRNEHDGQDAFELYRVDEQIQKALSRKVWLPSGGTLVIDRTEAMTVIDVNTGKFTGSGGNLEETVTRNNLEAAEEIVRQMRLRDLGGMIVVDFIDMVLPENQELVLRRLKEALGRDRTRHQVSEVTSLGLVQMTRKRLGTGLVETFATECECCNGRGIILHQDPVEDHDESDGTKKKRRPRRKPSQDPAQHPAAVAMHRHEDAEDASASQPSEASSSIEDLAAAVVVEDAADTDSKSDADSDSGADSDSKSDSRSGSHKRRRRGSRGGRKGVSKGADANTADIVDIATTASDNAEEGDDVQEFNSYVSDEPVQTGSQPAQTYEEALEEFEKSPRRKRKTRGNSRSDKRPRPEDFETKPEPAPEPAQEPEVEEQDKSDKPEKSDKSGTRGRRRGTRRSSKSTKPAEQTTEQSVEHESAQDEPQSEPLAKSTVKSSKGRRRAVRKNTAPKAAEQSAEQPAENPADAAETTKAPVVKTRRGRKRAVKKSVSKAASKSATKSAPKAAEKPADEPKAQDKPAKSGRGRRRVARRSSK